MEKIDCKNIKELEKILQFSDKFTLVTHTHPDGDAAGSTTALLNYLISRGKDAVIAFADPLGENLHFILNEEIRDRVIICSEEPEKLDKRLEETEVLILLDANAFNRTAGMEDMLERHFGLQARKEVCSAQGIPTSKKKTILIDHHLNPCVEAFDLIFSETEISSACELLFYLLMELEDIHHDAKRLPAASAWALMAGMTTDTNNFANSTYPSTLVMASELLAAGVDRDALLSHLYNQYREERVRLMGTFLKDLMKITEEGVAYAILDKKTQNYFHMGIGDTEGFVNIPLSIQKVRMSLFLKEDDEHYRVSIRSKIGTSANQMAMRYFHGGGHECAAGGKLIFGKDIEVSDDSEPTQAAAHFIEAAVQEFFA